MNYHCPTPSIYLLYEICREVRLSISIEKIFAWWQNHFFIFVGDVEVLQSLLGDFNTFERVLCSKVLLYHLRIAFTEVNYLKVRTVMNIQEETIFSALSCLSDATAILSNLAFLDGGWRAYCFPFVHDIHPAKFLFAKEVLQK